ncbi:DUF2007 domain-containing protein [Rhodocytophaga aerolata]|jgi:type III secretory pathway lipoprotein EscJ|uniref:DUF2007 domain-containing protein n=1 Tax=Rhodocytophaga aerolata TaxID=455078 RepID=A0ABT8QYL2_9BACT|nr:DUF2007 domain-containing protein [Rhodocytophaga aerolata]MDO1444931.1 DUF2007 domain-containing protein [Rhodocytophaga aerolata]
MNNWQKVYTSLIGHQAEIVKGVLETHGIPAVVMNRKDSSYHFGHFEVLVPADNTIEALKIISDEINFK